MTKTHLLYILLPATVMLSAGCGGSEDKPAATEHAAAQTAQASSNASAGGESEAASPSASQATASEAPAESPAPAGSTGLSKQQPPVRPVQMLNGSFDRVNIKLATGEPKAVDATRDAYWLWIDADQTWHLRMTAGQEKTFKGIIAPEEDELANFSGTEEAMEKRYKFRGQKLVFAVAMQGGPRGFDFDAEYAKCLRFRLLTGVKDTPEILLGKDAKPAKGNRFKICYR